MKILQFDSYKSLLPTKNALHLKLISGGAVSFICGAGDVSDGIKADCVLQKFREGLDLVLIWNGNEIGCDWIRAICGKFKVPYAYIEQGFLPQKDTISVFTNPEKILEFEEFEEFDFDEEELFEKFSSKFPFERGVNIDKEKVVVPMQLSYDASLYRMEDPTNDFFRIISGYVEASIDFDGIIKRIVICPHPQNPNDYRKFDTFPIKNLGVKIKVSNRGFLTEIKDCVEVIGYNSTSLYESRLLGVPTVSAGNIFLQSCYPRKSFLASVEAHQFDPTNDTFEEITKKIWKNTQ